MSLIAFPNARTLATITYDVTADQLERLRLVPATPTIVMMTASPQFSTRIKRSQAQARFRVSNERDVCVSNELGVIPSDPFRQRWHFHPVRRLHMPPDGVESPQSIVRHTVGFEEIIHERAASGH
jgi:hypothetical protein